MNISEKLFNTTTKVFEFGGISDVYLCSNDKELNEEQLGYAINGVTGEPIAEWFGENYIVIGHDSACGDPFIVKVDEENFPVYYMFHDDWDSLEKISESFDDFIETLNLLKHESDKECVGTDFDELKRNVFKKNNGQDFYWDALIEDIKEAYV